MTEIWEELRAAAYQAKGHWTSRRTWLDVEARARDLIQAERPVATREAVREWINNITLPRYFAAGDADWVSFILAALSHFAPDRPRMQIEGMTMENITDEMEKSFGSTCRGISISAARVAHRLANTSAPIVDPDAGAKRLAWEYKKANTPPGILKDLTPDSWWAAIPEEGRIGWRAVAKEVQA